MHKVFIMLLGITCLTFSQENRNYFIYVEGGVGVSRYLSTLSMDGLIKNGVSASLSAYWQPEHLLEVGIETGYNYLYSYNNNELTEFGMSQASASLISLPLILKFRMRVFDNLKLHAGSGLILLFNRGEAFNDKFYSRLLSIIDHIGFSYSYALSGGVQLGGSVKYTYIFREEESYITFQLNAAYKILEW